MTPASPAKPDRRPPYQHAADELRREIKAGRYKPGEQLPSYRELQERFQVANMTARSALGVLRDEGLIYTIQGRGSFVADFEGSGADYTAPAWYLGKPPEGPAEESAASAPREWPPGESPFGDSGEAKAGGADPSLSEMLTALRDEIRALSVEHQELRREFEELKKAQQSPRS
ncbi:GntR family transcriptional regulator [Streptomyces spinosisporus]|jgi:DNA-binding transcriptional MocR family regulator|uniref:GntR family transcriptional regulator n=1 Tax=Streptomyces spinosisporus TaxID=2927582 RepID=A0ABS9XFL9_9ACTN|nr:GntR family transcriptional regulator [Streptomyces spinosisporus]MCI3240883.1 GntR family transcriptional regulator [Streptomyces spinosisporus]